MKKNKEKEYIEVHITSVYQLLVASCRYAYTRNNHLEPFHSYTLVKDIFPHMLNAKANQAIHTLRQICEECINMEIVGNFYDGEDDEFNNRMLSIKFINWCLEEIRKHDKNYTPYNYDLFENNLKKDSEPRYRLYDITDENNKIEITKDPVSVSDYIQVMFDYCLPEDKREQYATYCKDTHYQEDSRKKANYTYHIMTPVQKEIFVEHI